jgi:hypothetical protein
MMTVLYVALGRMHGGRPTEMEIASGAHCMRSPYLCAYLVHVARECRRQRLVKVMHVWVVVGNGDTHDMIAWFICEWELGFPFEGSTSGKGEPEGSG